jgi:hypothetical protein
MEFAEAGRQFTVHERADREADEAGQIRGRDEMQIEIPIKEELLPRSDEWGDGVQPDPDLILGRDNGGRVDDGSQKE